MPGVCDENKWCVTKMNIIEIIKECIAPSDMVVAMAMMLTNLSQIFSSHQSHFYRSHFKIRFLLKSHEWPCREPKHININRTSYINSYFDKASQIHSTYMVSVVHSTSRHIKFGCHSNLQIKSGSYATHIT